MDENRSSGTLCCSWSISAHRSSDIGDRLLALVCRANTRLWINGVRGSRFRVDIGGLGSNATIHPRALLTATVQLVAMLGDIVAGEPAGLPAAVFRSYLLSDTAYLGLLISQCLIMAIAIGSWAIPHLHGHWLASLKMPRK